MKLEPTLKPGKEVVDQEGVLGETEIKTTYRIKNGEVIEFAKGEKRQTIAPVKKIVRIGAKTTGDIEHTEKVPFEYEIEYDPTMKAGDFKVVTEGKAVSMITKWKITNSKQDGEPTVVEEKPVNAVTKVEPCVCPLPEPQSPAPEKPSEDKNPTTQQQLIYNQALDQNLMFHLT